VPCTDTPEFRLKGRILVTALCYSAAKDFETKPPDAFSKYLLFREIFKSFL